MDDASTSRPSLSSGDLCVDTCQEHKVRAARHQHTSWSTHFPKRNGLQATPISAFTNGSVYSIVQLYKPLSVSGYQRLLDFNAGVGDTGPSQLSGNLLAYPIAAGTGAALISTTALQLNRIDSNVTKLVTARINGTRVLQFTDTGDVYRIAATSLRFFKDNTSGGAKITGAASGPKVIYRGQ